MTAHPFKKWLVQQHGKADTAVGDLARDVRLDPGFPTRGERRDLRNYLAECGAESDALVTFEEAWALYEPDGSPADHPFVTWLLRRDLRAHTPLSGFARHYSSIFPSSGDRERLRADLEDYVGDDAWVLTCFDVAWEQWETHAVGELL